MFIVFTCHLRFLPVWMLVLLFSWITSVLIAVTTFLLISILLKFPESQSKFRQTDGRFISSLQFFCVSFKIKRFRKMNQVNINVREIRSLTDRLLIGALATMTDLRSDRLEWSNCAYFNNDEPDETQRSAYMIFGDQDVAGLLQWYFALDSLEYALREYTLGLILAATIDGERCVSFISLTNERAFGPREADHFFSAIHGALYAHFDVIRQLAAQREPQFTNRLRQNEYIEPLPDHLEIIGVVFSVREINDFDDTESESGSESDYSTSDSESEFEENDWLDEVIENDRDQNIDQILRYLLDDSSGYSSLEE